MRRSRVLAITGAVAVAAASVMGSSTATAAPSVAAATTAATAAGAGSYIVLAKAGADAQALAAALTKAGATVTSVNTAIGMVSIEAASGAVVAAAKGMSTVQGVATDRAIGHAPKAGVDQKVLKENVLDATGTSSGPSDNKGKSGAKQGADPMDAQLWDMAMMQVPEAHQVTLGNKKVRVGVIDTGVDGQHPDIAPNFDAGLSRNFVTDMPDIDGDCEVASCVDPVDVDDDGHGTHVAGTIAAALNGQGISGVAPNVGLVNIRAGQDSGYFFVGPTVNALTYAGDAGIDVVNMSFYVDPWLYNCQGGAPEDTPEQAAEQNTIIAAVNRALEYAHSKNVTMVAALGNDNDNIDAPRADVSSPDYGTDPHRRTIDPSKCFDLPTQGAHVIGVSSVGPSKRKADYSNWAGNLTSGSLEVAAPGGWFRDGFGTPTYRTNGNLILSAAPLHVLQEAGQVDEAGEITASGAAAGVQKDCSGDTCGYYQWLQGTSMASPHAAGVAALIVSRFGKNMPHQGFGMAPDAVRDRLMATAVDTPCPAGGIQSYTQEGRSAAYTATCTGTTQFNSFTVTASSTR